LDQCDFVSGSGHKFEGGKGAGFVILPEEEMEIPFHGIIGGPQENGHRAGTENLPGVAAMVTALLARDEGTLNTIAEIQSRFRAGFEATVSAEGECRVLAPDGPRLWNTSMLVVPFSKNLKWLTRLSQRGFCVSTGSACSAGKGNPSTVMTAMGLSFEEMGRVIRVSGGWETTESDWKELSAAFLKVGAELRIQ
jgi:cysteine desulfurase